MFNLEVLPDVMILLSRSPDNGCGENGVFSMTKSFHFENGEWVFHRVIAIMIAEGALISAFVRRDDADQREISFCQKRKGTDPRISDLRHAAPLQQRGEYQLGNVLRQGGHGGEDECGGSTEEQVGGERFAQLFRLMVMKPYASMNLEVHPDSAVVVNLVTIHAEVGPSGGRMLRVNQRERDERTAVLGPTLNLWKRPQARRVRDSLDHGSGGACFCPALQSTTGQITKAPEPRQSRRQQHLGCRGNPAEKTDRILSKREVDAAAGTEKVRRYRKLGARDSGKQQRRSLANDRTPLNLGQIQMRIDRLVDDMKFSFATQCLQKTSEIRMSLHATNLPRIGRIARKKNSRVFVIPAQKACSVHVNHPGQIS